jgi:hypothetical protein
MWQRFPIERRWMSASWLAEAVAALAVCAPFWIGQSCAAETAVAEATKLAADAVQPTIEVIRERFADGKIKIEREVTTDPDGNYVNQAPGEPGMRRAS